MVVLAETSPPFRALRMYIGQPEARAIQAGWWGTLPPRPSTWDLFLSTLQALGARLDRAVISRAEEGRHFFADLELSQGEVRCSVPCRPSDAIALAVRLPLQVLYATEEVMAAAGELPPAEPPA
jgi:bifunctional DNase/RNase